MGQAKIYIRPQMDLSTASSDDSVEEVVRLEEVVLVITVSVEHVMS